MFHYLQEYIQRVHDSWTENKLDALICPPFPIAAPPIPNADLCFGESRVIVSGYCYDYCFCFCCCHQNSCDLKSGVNVSHKWNTFSTLI